MSSETMRIESVSRRNASSWLWLWMFFPLSTVLTIACACSAWLLWGPTTWESSLWFAHLLPVATPLGLGFSAFVLVLAVWRTLQLLGVLGVIYLRVFDDGSALLGSWWRVRKGHGLTVNRHTKVRLTIIDGQPKMFGWTTKTGIPVYMVWRLSRTGATFNWLTPFQATPDANTHLNTALQQLPEPTHEHLDTSQAAHAATRLRPGG